MRSRSSLAAAVLALVATAGCQKPDVGGQCTLAWNPTWEQDGTARPPTASQLYTSNGSDYFESGNLACDGLVCIVSPAPAGSEYGSSVPGQGYCSKPCVSNADCYSSDTGLVCDQIVLDPAFIATLDQTTKDRYLGQIRFSSYCVVPRQ